MRNLIALTDTQIEDMFNEYVAVEFEKLTFTQETIADFKASRGEAWSERGSIVEDEAGLFWVENAQVTKGAQRREIVVIDFGPVRGVAVA